MRIGIVTITNGQNYGNRLQNYALQEVLKELGHEPETIWNNTGAWENLGIYSRFKYWVRSSFHLKYSPQVDRIRKFVQFNRGYITWSKYTVEISKIPSELENEYDVFICGSDQIWNPYYKRTSGIDFLSFAPKEKRIAYAASLGVSEVGTEQKEILKKYLNDFPVISVREQKGADILFDILKREIPVVPDPTVLVEREKWDNLQKKPGNISEDDNYILTYFLGENPKAMEDAEILCEKYGYHLIQLEDCYTDGKNNPYFITMDPREFLWLLAHAEMFLTDSYHGCVFSIIFEKKFLVYSRSFHFSMESRIDQLLTTYGLESHRAGQDIKENMKILERNVKVSELLKKERNKGIDFLRQRLDDAKKN